MTTDQIKQRLAEWQSFDITGTLKDLLRDALAVIEQQEQSVAMENLQTLSAQITQLESQLREREAQCAATREAFAKFGSHKPLCEHNDIESPLCTCGYNKALATDAGKAMLERLQKAEGEAKDLRWKLKTYAMFRLRCDACGDLFNEHHQGDGCPGAFYKNCKGTLQFNLPEAVKDRLQAVEKKLEQAVSLLRSTDEDAISRLLHESTHESGTNISRGR